jgi:metallophosphoesterase superfamily enzyme
MRCSSPISTSKKPAGSPDQGRCCRPYDSVATLTDLTAVVVETGAREVWCLGDSFPRPARLRPAAAAGAGAAHELTAATNWTWITGNHDPVVADPCGGALAEDVEVDGLILRHEADPAETRPELSGHFHPSCASRIAAARSAAAASSRPSASWCCPPSARSPAVWM